MVTAEVQPQPTITVDKPKKPKSQWLRFTLLTLGAVIFLFPFYYMVVGSFQAVADKTVRGMFPEAGNVTTVNYTEINEAINVPQGLLNSTIFAIGVLLGTIVFGLLAGWALAVIEFRGRGTMLSGMLLLLIVPFQLLMIPLYVLLVRYYGLADTYMGMILPFLINSTAVFIFRQYFLQIPRELFESARLDGASEMRDVAAASVFRWPGQRSCPQC